MQRLNLQTTGWPFPVGLGLGQSLLRCNASPCPLTIRCQHLHNHQIQRCPPSSTSTSSTVKHSIYNLPSDFNAQSCLFNTQADRYILTPGITPQSPTRPSRIITTQTCNALISVSDHLSFFPPTPLVYPNPQQQINVWSWAMALGYIHGLLSLSDKLKKPGAGKMAQQVRKLAKQACLPQFDPLNPHNSGREELISQLS